MRLLAIDPGSERTGWAVFVGRKLQTFGLAASTSRDPYDRIAAIIAQLQSTRRMLYPKPGSAVIEMPSGHQHGSKRGRLNLTTYGVAVGAIWQWLRTQVPVQNVVCVSANKWTAGASKQRRAAELRMMHPILRDTHDPKLDIHDAIGLGEWWLWQRAQELWFARFA